MGKHIFTGKNVVDAINKGLKELNEKQENVDIKFLKDGGLFSKAKIEIITKDNKEKSQKQTQTEPKKTNEHKPKKKKTTTETNTKNKTQVSLSENDPVTFLEKFIGNMDKDIKIKTDEKGKEIKIDLEGGKASNLIGKRGETLYAIQNILNTIERNKYSNDKKFYILDIEEYRGKRKKSLENLADRIANKAIKTGRQQKLEPMNAYERKIIHDSLSGKDVNTYSKGEEPKRYLVIEKK